MFSVQTNCFHLCRRGLVRQKNFQEKLSGSLEIYVYLKGNFEQIPLKMIIFCKAETLR